MLWLPPYSLCREYRTRKSVLRLEWQMVVAFGFAGVIPQSIMYALRSLGQREDSLAVQVLRWTMVSLTASTW